MKPHAWAKCHTCRIHAARCQQNAVVGAAYMVPEMVVPMDELPRLPNGKINRRGLPEPDFSNRDQSDYAEPKGEAEEKVQEIWQEVGTKDDGRPGCCCLIRSTPWKACLGKAKYVRSCSASRHSCI